MAGEKISKKQKKFTDDTKKLLTLSGFNVQTPLKENKEALISMRESYWEAAKAGDLEAMGEIFEGILALTNKTKLAKIAGIGRRTLYSKQAGKICFNLGAYTVKKVFDALDEMINNIDEKNKKKVA